MTEELAAPSTVGVGDVLQLFRQGRARTTSEVAALTGLSRGTASGRLDVLRDLRLIVPAGVAESSGGRPPAQLTFNPRAGVVLAFDLEATHLTVGVVDLASEILVQRTAEIAIKAGPETVLDETFRIGYELLAETGRAPDLLGIGVGLPGAVAQPSGRPVAPPIMPGWDDFDVPGYVTREFGAPVFVDNDVNVLAIGERALRWPDVEDLVFVKVATGIGAGVIAGGRLQRGAQGSAGELGHVLVPSGRGASGRIQIGELASGTAIAERLRASGAATETNGDVVRLLHAGDADAIAATRQAGRELGEVIAVVINLLNPSVVVVGGSLARAGGHLIAGVSEVVYARAIPVATQHLTITPSIVGNGSGVVGAAILASEQLLSPGGIEWMVRRAASKATAGVDARRA